MAWGDMDATRRAGWHKDLNEDDSFHNIVSTHFWIPNGDNHRHCVRSNVALVFYSDACCKRYMAVNDLSDLMREHRSSLMPWNNLIARIHRIRLNWWEFLNRRQRLNCIL
jgi:hypothetical protein